MKRIRILTGRHIGSSLDLEAGVHRIGSGQDCDIAITDWDFATLDLDASDEGVTARWQSAAQDDSGTVRAGEHKFVDFAAHRFGNIVLCVGPSDATWPADVQLLDHIFQPTPQRVANWAGKRLLAQRRRFGPLAVGALVCLVAVMALTLWLYDPTPPPPTLQAARQALQAKLTRLSPQKLHVTTEGNSLVISGIVENSDVANRVRQEVTGSHGPYPVIQRFAVATDVAETIRSTLGLANATVRYQGDGVFSVVAEADNLNAARASISRIQDDLAPVVKRIDVSLEAATVPDKTPIRSRMSSEELQVVQTRDGVKHMVLKSADDSPVTIGEVLALPSPLSRPVEPASPPQVTPKE
jgi:type III secretion protein D